MPNFPLCPEAEHQWTARGLLAWMKLTCLDSVDVGKPFNTIVMQTAEMSSEVSGACLGY